MVPVALPISSTRGRVMAAYTTSPASVSTSTAMAAPAMSSTRRQRRLMRKRRPGGWSRTPARRRRWSADTSCLSPSLPRRCLLAREALGRVRSTRGTGSRDATEERLLPDGAALAALVEALADLRQLGGDVLEGGGAHRLCLGAATEARAHHHDGGHQQDRPGSDGHQAGPVATQPGTPVQLAADAGLHPRRVSGQLLLAQLSLLPG